MPHHLSQRIAGLTAAPSGPTLPEQDRMVGNFLAAATVFSVTVITSGDAAVVHVDGEVDRATGDVFAAAVAMTDSASTAMVDLADARFVDVRGAALLVDTAHRRVAGDGHFVVLDGRATVRRVLQLMDPSDCVTFMETCGPVGWSPAKGR